jgi:hypothetical protein
VAGRLGHGGGGTTTLRVYTAFVSESDQRTAQTLFSRLPSRPNSGRHPNGLASNLVHHTSTSRQRSVAPSQAESSNQERPYLPPRNSPASTQCPLGRFDGRYNCSPTGERSTARAESLDSGASG